MPALLPIRTARPAAASLACWALLALSAPNRQVIDGRFDGYQDGIGLVARIRAVDGSDWDVEASDAAVLQGIATEYPGSHGPVCPEDLGG